MTVCNMLKSWIKKRSTPSFGTLGPRVRISPSRPLTLQHRSKFSASVVPVSAGIILALLLSFSPGQSTVIEGAYDPYTPCVWEWRVWATNANYHDRPGNFYEIAHGDSREARPYCGRPAIHPDQITGYRFGFFASCGGMCSNADGTFAESVPESVGYCGMSEPYCAENCWLKVVGWQDIFYREKNAGASVQSAFDAAMNEVPECLPCLRYHKKREPKEVNPTQVVMTTIIVPWLMRNR